VVITAYQFSKPSDRIVETFTFLVKPNGDPLAYKAVRASYTGIIPEDLPSEAIVNHAEKFAPQWASHYLFEHREELGLTAWTGYDVELHDGTPYDVTLLFCAGVELRKSVWRMAEVTACTDLEKWIDKLSGSVGLQQRYVDQQDIQ
jgi:hypothetical protein